MQRENTRTFTEWLKLCEKNKNITVSKTTFNSKDSIYNKSIALVKAEINTNDLNNN